MGNSLLCLLYEDEGQGKDWVLEECTVAEMQEARRRAGQFYATLSSEQRQMYQDIQADESKQLVCQMQMQYRRGFRAGAKIMMEILSKEE